MDVRSVTPDPNKDADERHAFSTPEDDQQQTQVVVGRNIHEGDKAKPAQESSKTKVDDPKGGQFSESQKAMIRDLFEEVYSVRKWRLFWINFFRGIFLGFGTVVGGTILVGALVWVLSQTVDWFPAISDFIQRLIDSLSTGKP